MAGKISPELFQFLAYVHMNMNNLFCFIVHNCFSPRLRFPAWSRSIDYAHIDIRATPRSAVATALCRRASLRGNPIRFALDQPSLK
jgi:hypothetical protein